MLVRDSPPAVDFAQADGQSEAVLGILLQLLSGPQCVCKGDIVPGDASSYAVRELAGRLASVSCGLFHATL